MMDAGGKKSRLRHASCYYPGKKTEDAETILVCPHLEISIWDRNRKHAASHHGTAGHRGKNLVAGDAPFPPVISAP